MPRKTADQESRQKAEEHVEWFLQAIKPLLEDFMIHGFKHGYERAKNETHPAHPTKAK